MIILNTPFKLSDGFRIITDWLKCAFMGNVNPNAKLHFVYFSYQPDYEFVTLSIKSLLANIDDNKVGSITIFEDATGRFLEQQKQALLSLSNKLCMSEVNGFSWASTQTTKAEIDAFTEVANTSDDNDLIVKVDSDILFLPSTKLTRCVESGARCIGDGHYEDYKFMQGGLYMIRAKEVREVLSPYGIKEIEAVETANNCVGEDKTISSIMSVHSTILDTRLMLFPGEYQHMTGFHAFVKWDFAAIHFVKDKHNMKDYVQDIL